MVTFVVQTCTQARQIYSVKRTQTAGACLPNTTLAPSCLYDYWLLLNLLIKFEVIFKPNTQDTCGTVWWQSCSFEIMYTLFTGTKHNEFIFILTEAQQNVLQESFSSSKKIQYRLNAMLITMLRNINVGFSTGFRSEDWDGQQKTTSKIQQYI